MRCYFTLLLLLALPILAFGQNPGTFKIRAKESPELKEGEKIKGLYVLSDSQRNYLNFKEYLYFTPDGRVLRTISELPPPMIAKRLDKGDAFGQADYYGTFRIENSTLYMRFLVGNMLIYYRGEVVSDDNICLEQLVKDLRGPHTEDWVYLASADRVY